jgi:hypothetical protein
MNAWPHLLIAGVAAFAPALTPRPAPPAAGFPGWPAAWDGRPLTPLPETAVDRTAAERFPGRIGRFAAGDRAVVLRWIPTPHRALHPAADCLRASGWTVTPGPPERDDAGWWATLRARRDGQAIRLREQIRGADGRTWSDPSWWWWDAAGDAGGFWAVTEEWNEATGVQPPQTASAAASASRSR